MRTANGVVVYLFKLASICVADLAYDVPPENSSSVPDPEKFPVLLPASQGKGLEISGQLSSHSGKTGTPASVTYPHLVDTLHSQSSTF
jgi:hypothetical protein